MTEVLVYGSGECDQLGNNEFLILFKVWEKLIYSKVKFQERSEALLAKSTKLHVAQCILYFFHP